MKEAEELWLSVTRPRELRCLSQIRLPYRPPQTWDWLGTAVLKDALG